MLDIIFTEIEKYTLNLSRLYIIFTIYVFSEMFIIRKSSYFNLLSRHGFLSRFNLVREIVLH